jgi:hypothetical protein
MMLSSFHRPHVGGLLAAFSFIASCSMFCVSQQPIFVDGLWAQDKIIVLLARFDQCGAPYRPIQPIVSRDGGKTWAANGPRFESSDFMFLLSDGPQLWIAGEDIAEGPSSSPFLLTYRVDLDQWSQSEIYGDAADLIGVAQESNRGHVLAWVEHLDVASDDSGPLFLHESVDGGRTWDHIKNVEHVPSTVPGLRFFGPLPQRSGAWRIAGAGNAIEHRMADGKWHPGVKLPLPMQQQCPVEEDDTRQ